MYEEQLFAMGKRCKELIYLDLCALGETDTPTDKIRKLRDIIDLYKIALGRE